MRISFHLYKDAKNEWRWRLLSRNGNLIADSGEGYANALDCLGAINEIQTDAAISTIWNTEVSPPVFIRTGPAVP